MDLEVLDVCCGSKMFWFERKDKRALYIDKRKESHQLKDSSSAGGYRQLIVDPDIQADFTNLPFEDDSFQLCVFDPPHLVRNGRSGWLAKKYGKLEGDWRNELKAGFAECFRVLKPGGTLIFKWNEYEVPVSQILTLTPEKPLIGNRCGKQQKSHWLVFMKRPSSEQVNSMAHIEQPNIICPHCEHRFDDEDMHSADEDLWALPPNEGEAEVECPVCDKEFFVRASYSPLYSTAFCSDELF